MEIRPVTECCECFMIGSSASQALSQEIEQIKEVMVFVEMMLKLLLVVVVLFHLRFLLWLWEMFMPVFLVFSENIKRHFWRKR